MYNMRALAKVCFRNNGHVHGKTHWRRENATTAHDEWRATTKAYTAGMRWRVNTPMHKTRKSIYFPWRKANRVMTSTLRCWITLTKFPTIYASFSLVARSACVPFPLARTLSAPVYGRLRICVCRMWILDIVRARLCVCPFTVGGVYLVCVCARFTYDNVDDNDDVIRDSHACMYFCYVFIDFPFFVCRIWEYYTTAGRFAGARIHEHHRVTPLIDFIESDLKFSC